MHSYEIRSLPLWLQPIVSVKHRINFFGIIHQHVILFIKCHFCGSGELCVNHIHNGLNWPPNIAFSATIYLCEIDFSALAYIKRRHEIKGQSSLIKGQHCQTLNHEFRSWPYGCKVNRRIDNVCEIHLPFEIKCYEMHFCGKMLWQFVAFFQNNVLYHNGYNIICIEKRVVRGHKVCKNTKGVTNRKRLRNTTLEENARPSTKYSLLKVAPEPN